MVYMQTIDSPETVGDVEEVEKEMVATEAAEVRVGIIGLTQKLPFHLEERIRDRSQHDLLLGRIDHHFTAEFFFE